MNVNVPWLKPALWGAVLGAVVTMIVGFSWLGWVLGSTADRVARERTDAAVASAAIARAYPTAWEGVNARTYGPPGLEDDLRWCTQENTLSVVPRFTRMVGPAAEIMG